jgi:hypothetical protein
LIRLSKNPPFPEFLVHSCHEAKDRREMDSGRLGSDSTGS